MLGDINQKVGGENIFKPTGGNNSLHKESYVNVVRMVKFAKSKNLFVESTMVLHHNIHKYNWTSSYGKTHIQIDHTLIDWKWHTST
jgi:hypothetical protein